ncbi:hypothetical protein [Leptolyngbya phage Lbo-JY46]
MITYFMCRQFYKSGEFNESKNPYAGFDMFLRMPIFVLLDIFLVFKFITLL